MKKLFIIVEGTIVVTICVKVTNTVPVRMKETIHFNIHFNSVGWKFGRLYSVRANVELVCHDLSKNSLLRVNSRGRDKAVHFIGYVVVESEILRSIDELSSTLTTNTGHIN